MANTWERFDEGYYEDHARGLVLVKETTQTIGSLFFPEGTEPGWFVYKKGHDTYGKKKNRAYIGPFATITEAKAAADTFSSKSKPASPPKVKVVGKIPSGEPVKPITKSVLRDAAGKSKATKKTKPKKKKGERGAR
jgi:hypothetical protein